MSPVARWGRKSGSTGALVASAIGWAVAILLASTDRISSTGDPCWMGGFNPAEWLYVRISIKLFKLHLRLNWLRWLGWPATSRLAGWAYCVRAASRGLRWVCREGVVGSGVSVWPCVTWGYRHTHLPAGYNSYCNLVVASVPGDDWVEPKSGKWAIGRWSDGMQRVRGWQVGGDWLPLSQGWPAA